jgi:NAD(P)-dependent dehydrogenase (short-subunit alcohol dehydrogenase family)
MMTRWQFPLPSLAVRRAVVTGASGGLGFDTAAALVAAGAEVILAARDETKGARALRQLRASQPTAKASLALLDLARLASVKAFADRLLDDGRPLDLLINNAGVMALPQRRVSADGFELQLATNYLGHYALTAQLLPLLRRAAAPRVVQLSSLAHRGGRIDFGDLQGERDYRPWRAYRQSKLAMLMFALELQRRSDTHGWGLTSHAAHPGWARTELIANGPASTGGALGFNLYMLLAPWLSQSSAEGALPSLLAATSGDAGGSYYGPQGIGELTGPAGRARIAKQALDRQVAARLWEVSATLTGSAFPTA